MIPEMKGYAYILEILSSNGYITERAIRLSLKRNSSARKNTTIASKLTSLTFLGPSMLMRF